MNKCDPKNEKQKCVKLEHEENGEKEREKERKCACASATRQLTHPNEKLQNKQEN